jgi:crossover junction endodeoxyribonuclease RuvC
MRVLGIDSGSRVTGYGVIESDGPDCAFVGCGVIRVAPSHQLPERLKSIHDGLVRVISDYRPDVAAFEGVFHAANVQSALKLGHARGVCIHAAVSANLAIYEYSPLEVKSAVTGYGRAEKPQVQQMVWALLSLGERTDPYPSARTGPGSRVSSAGALRKCSRPWRCRSQRASGLSPCWPA